MSSFRKASSVARDHERGKAGGVAHVQRPDAPHYPEVLAVAALLLPSLHRLDARPGRVYTGQQSDQHGATGARAQRRPGHPAVTVVGHCLALAAVLLVLALVP